MIWYNEQVSVPNAPAGSSVRLIGVYDHLVELKAEIIAGPEVTTLVLILYTHNPSGLGYQEAPLAEDIRQRYLAKINKARARLQATDFHKLGTIKQIP